MENTDSYPVFHTRLAEAYRRRTTGADSRDAGYLILNAADQFVEIMADAADAFAVPDERHPRLPRQLQRIPRRVPGAQCPVPGCDHRHDPDDPPVAVG